MTTGEAPALKYKKESSKPVHPVEIYEVTNIKITVELINSFCPRYVSYRSNK